MSKLILALLIMCASIPVYAQPGNPGGEDPDVPIGGIEILVAAGALLGLWKYILPGKSRAGRTH